MIAVISEPRDARRKTPLAVALGRDADRQGVARVKASGRGFVAEQILAIAFDRGIKVREDANLASVLVALELDTPIPVGVLSTVAEILSYVYRADGAAPANPEDTR